MDIKIIVATHKPYRMPTDDIYYPLHLGRENAEGFGLPGDNTGDNISAKNSYYNEMTGVYWAWKNLDAEYIGLAHYRRHFACPNKHARDPYERIASRTDIEKILSKYDVILPAKRWYYIETNESHFLHLPFTYESDLASMCQVIRELTPEYIPAMDFVLKRRWAHMFNMFVMKREQFNSYCEWVFKILEETDKRIDMTDRKPIEARFYISELLMDMWVEANHIKYCEMPVVFVEKENMACKGWMLIKRMLGLNYKEKKVYARHYVKSERIMRS